MGRLYSGNLMNFQAALSQIFELDLNVTQEREFETWSRQNVYTLKILTHSGAELASCMFMAHDEDVLYNDMTSWLKRQHYQLSSWK
ncbi:dGTP triphosphohydrolase inhibitor [Yersinia phage vB_YenP_Rambo]|uniref:dGTP triphosphohydrolase inhibitor n=1 Tax=Yersinia phage vB_YenP_Rambo TaxID=2880894 RepID=A0AC61TNQ1_9CAUD|nr:dGTP triphosphohydrolase inhibitor [Yersinia phage vB_YenP_Rambo]